MALLLTTTDYISDKKRIHIFGYRTNVSESNWDALTFSGGDYPFQQTAVSLELETFTSKDGPTGPNAREITIEGLDANGDEIIEVVTLIAVGPLGGIHPVSGTFLRVNKAFVSSCGTYGASNANNIIIQVASAGDILGVITGTDPPGTGDILYGDGETQNGIYSVPAGKTAYITRFSTTVFGEEQGHIRLYQRNDYTDTSEPFKPRRLIWASEGLLGMDERCFNTFIEIEEKSDIWFRAISPQADNVPMSVDFDIILVDNK